MRKSSYKMVNKIIKKELQNEFVMELFKTAKELMPIVDGVLTTPVLFNNKSCLNVMFFLFIIVKSILERDFLCFIKSF